MRLADVVVMRMVLVQLAMMMTATFGAKDAIRGSTFVALLVPCQHRLACTCRSLCGLRH